MIIEDGIIAKLREDIKSYLKPKRYPHVLAVEKEAVALGKIYLPNDINKLQISALFHDITKRLDFSEHIKICEEFGLDKKEYEKENEKTMHQLTGSLIAKRDFANIVDDEIICGIRWHTTGHNNMTMFENLIFLADYIEETRTWPDCIVLRKYFYDNLAQAKNQEDKIKVLYMTMVKAFDYTIANLKEEKLPINTDTLDARNYFNLLLEKGTVEDK